MKTTMAEHHRDQEQYLSSLQSDHEGATIVNTGEVIQNHNEGHHCNSPSSPTTTITTTSAPNSYWVHRQNHPATSPINESPINLAVHNNTFNFFSSPPEPRAADADNNIPDRRCNCRNCAKFLRKRWTITTPITLVVILVVVGGFVYSVKPNKLKFTIDDISIQGFSNTTDLALSPPSLFNYTTSCNITMKVRNPNKLFGIYHDEGSVISVHHRNTELFHGAAPSLFYQKAMNETTLKISLKNDSSSSIGLLKKMQDSKELADGMIPLDVRFGARATFKFSSVSIKVTIWADCRLIVNALAVDSKILSQHCPVTLDFALFAQHFKL